MRVKNDMLSFNPQIPEQWKAYSFKVNFRHQILKVNVTQKETTFELDGTQDLQILVNDKLITISPNSMVTV
jgi:maltose phosphorylase